MMEEPAAKRARAEAPLPIGSAKAISATAVLSSGVQIVNGKAEG